MSRLNEGRYRGTAILAALGATNSEKRTPFIEVSLELKAEHGLVSRNWRGFLTENAAENTIKSLRAMGWNGNDIRELDGITASECSILLPMEIEAVVIHEPSRDNPEKVYDKVAFINRIGGGSSIKQQNKMSGAEVDEVAARIRCLCGPVDPERDAIRADSSQAENDFDFRIKGY